MRQPKRDDQTELPAWPPSVDRERTPVREPAKPRRVFVSHTAELRDLPPSRSFVEAVETAVGRAGDILVDTAYFDADPRPSAELDRDAVAGADVYVLLAGFRYGTTVLERPALSYPEHEFEVAGQQGIPRLVFLLSDQVEGPAALFVDPLHGARQVGFRQRLSDSGVVTSDVHSPEHAETAVHDALTRLRRTRSGLAPAGRISDLPARSPRLTVRQREPEALRAALTGPKPAVIQALTGPGGAGKTTLALEYAHRHADDYDIVWWIPAEQPDLIPDRLGTLAQALGVADATDTLPDAVTQLLRELRGQDRWLLVFDNAGDPTDVAPFLPGGTGHVLVTSRDPRWSSVTEPVPIGEFTRAESLDVLRSSLPDLSDGDGNRIAQALADLPVGVDQAAALLAGTGWTVPTYLDLLDDSTRSLLDGHDPGGYPLPVAASWLVAFDQLAAGDAAAAQLVTLAAWLAPDPVPLTVFTDQAAALPEPLATAAGDPLRWARMLRTLRRRAIARIGPDTLLLHRMPAAVLRTHSPVPDPEHGWPAQAVALLRAALPADRSNQAGTWPMWRVLLPHVVAVTDPARDTEAVADDAEWLVEHLAIYLHARGEPRVARPYFEQACRRYETRLGDNHASTLAAANNLAVVLRDLGYVDQADALDQDILDRLSRMLDDDEPGVPSPPRSLSEHEQAVKRGQDTFDRRRRILGEDHPETLNSAHSLADVLRRVGQHTQARDLDQDTLNRRRRILGDDHPDTRESARNLADTLHGLGQHEQARELEQWSLDPARGRS